MRSYTHLHASLACNKWTTPHENVCQDKELKTNRNGNSANFFSYGCNNKKIKELFASTLNGITASVRCVSSIVVVLNVKLARLIAAHATKKDSEKWKSSKEYRFLLVETHKHLTFIAVFTVHAKASLLYTFQRSMQTNRNINLWLKKSARLAVIPQ